MLVQEAAHNLDSGFLLCGVPLEQQFAVQVHSLLHVVHAYLLCAGHNACQRH